MSAALEPRKSQALYFIVYGEFVKVGLSKHPFKRAGQVLRDDTIRPDDMPTWFNPAVLGYIEHCNRADEHAVHMQLGPHHVVGEWFRAGEHIDIALNEYAPKRGDRGRFRGWRSCASIPEQIREAMDAAGQELERRLAALRSAA